jgi:hypothetical protein
MIAIYKHASHIGGSLPATVSSLRAYRWPASTSDRITPLFAAVRESAYGRFCCRSPLQAFLVSDSVAVMRFATGAGHDGAAESRPGTVFLFISSR